MRALILTQVCYSDLHICINFQRVSATHVAILREIITENKAMNWKKIKTKKEFKTIQTGDFLTH